MFSRISGRSPHSRLPLYQKKFLFQTFLSFSLSCIFTARKRSLRRLCFYTCLSVILFTGGEVPGQVPPRQVHPPSRYTPSGRYNPPAGTPPPQAGTPLRQVPSPRQVHPPDRYTPQAGTSPGQVHPTQCMLGYGQQAGGTHPTGMHSCFFLFIARKLGKGRGSLPEEF